MSLPQQNQRDANADHPMIELHDVNKYYKTAVGDFQALNSIDLQINAGEFVSIIGKSGSGKITLINMITGIDRPTSGEVWSTAHAVHKLSENQMARWRGKNLGIVFQFFQLLPTISVIENIMLPMDFCNTYPDARAREARPGPARHGRDGRPRLQAALRALRRSAAARGHRPRPGQRPAR